MPIGKSLCASLLGWAAFLTWESTVTRNHSSAELPPTTRPAQLPREGSPVDVDGAALLDQAIARLAQLPWLATEVRQRSGSGTGTGSWTAEGTLLRGPDGCARLELSLRNGNGPAGRFRVISDGRALAEVSDASERKATVVGVELSAVNSQRDAQLQQRGCGGPGALLTQLRTHGNAWKVVRGNSDAGVVYIVAGRLPSEARAVRVWLDAPSMWPLRIEWRGDAAPRDISEVEFLRPRLGQPLSERECAEAFTYRAE